MALTTLAGVIAGIQPPVLVGKASYTTGTAGLNHATPWIKSGFPAAGAIGSGLNGAALTGPALAGSIPYNNPISGETVIARLTSKANGGGGALVLVDRMWANSLNMTIGTAQNITFPGLPARDQLQQTNGAGVQLALEITTALAGATSPTITVT